MNSTYKVFECEVSLLEAELNRLDSDNYEVVLITFKNVGWRMSQVAVVVIKRKGPAHTR